MGSKNLLPSNAKIPLGMLTNDVTSQKKKKIEKNITE
jgi:hypothetical protein